MLIPRHERWPVLTSTQGYLIRNMRFINSRIRRYEMSSGIEDAVSEDNSLLIEESNNQRSFRSFMQEKASCDCWFCSGTRSWLSHNHEMLLKYLRLI